MQSTLSPRPPLWRSRIFWGQLASTAAILVFTALLIAALVDRAVRADLLQDLEDELRREAALAAPSAAAALTNGVPDTYQSQLEMLEAATGLRLTLIDASGRVLGDSEEDPARMDNHGRRPEVLAAAGAADGVGVATRYSSTLKLEMLYVARALGDSVIGMRGSDSGGSSSTARGFLRVALPLSVVQERTAVARRSVWVGTGIGLLLSLIAGAWLARRRAVPIATITQVADDMRDGRYDSRVELNRRDELGTLGDTLNRLGHELTERIARLSREDAQLRAMLSGMVEGVIAIDSEDRLVFANSAARSALGLPASEDLTGRKLWEVAPVAALEELLGLARRSNSVSRRELELHRMGTERIIDVQVASFSGGGQSGLVAVLHDITDLRRLERVRRDFVANVSHELKTPLTTIKGFVETLLDGALDDQENNVRFLQRIDVNVDRLANLVTDLLSLARIESQGTEVQRVPVDWREIMNDVVQRHEDVARKKGVELIMPADDSSLVVLGDREALTQVVDNLIDNAIKYTPAPGRVTVSLMRRGDLGVIAVEDTGVGIPEADMDRVFERFYRVDKARSREVGGTGLGLSIVKNLVMAMGGEVTLQGGGEGGARFEVELPLA